MNQRMNKRIGSIFERKVAQLLSGHGYWVHLLRDNQNGQPADMIAAKDGVALLIDAKHCAGAYFDTKRLEANQHLSMEKWRDTGNGSGLFAIGFPDQPLLFVRHHQLEPNRRYTYAQLLPLRDIAYDPYCF